MDLTHHPTVRGGEVLRFVEFAASAAAVLPAAHSFAGAEAAVDKWTALAEQQPELTLVPLAELHQLLT